MGRLGCGMREESNTADLDTRSSGVKWIDHGSEKEYSYRRLNLSHESR